MLRILSELAGAAMVAPIINPYEPGMTKEERKKIWEPWVLRRKVMYFLARRFPKFLSSFYRRSFLSGKHDRIDRWLSLSLGKKVSSLLSSSNSLHDCTLFFPESVPGFMQFCLLIIHARIFLC